MTHYDLSRELPKRDAKTVLEKHAVWRDETLQVSGPYQIAHPSREVELYDALAASEARAEALEPYIQEIWFEHRDHDGPGYNECDKPGEECAWCAGTRAALAAAAPPEPPQGVG
jgi:hypothetical protein